MDTFIHVTHWKAGSSWVRRILRQLAAERFVALQRDWDDPFPEPLTPGSVTSVYATREQCEAAELPPHRRLVVVRDLRDTLVSAYFSFRDTHRPNPAVAPFRARLQELGKDEGMLLLMDDFLPRCAAIQESWRGQPVVRYEELLGDDVGVFGRALGECDFAGPRARLERIVSGNRFRAVTGRSRGDEAPEHLRKGVAGDWRLHLSDRVLAEFEERFGRLVSSRYGSSAPGCD